MSTNVHSSHPWGCCIRQRANSYCAADIEQTRAAITSSTYDGSARKESSDPELRTCAAARPRTRRIRTLGCHRGPAGTRRFTPVLRTPRDDGVALGITAHRAALYHRGYAEPGALLERLSRRT